MTINFNDEVENATQICTDCGQTNDFAIINMCFPNAYCFLTETAFLFENERIRFVKEIHFNFFPCFLLHIYKNMC